MKYCLKCGTLLEDSHDRCIGCGTDVTDPDAWSLYPPEVAKSIEIEKEEKKSQTGLIIAMIAVFALLVAAIAVFIVFNAKKMKEAPATNTEETVVTEEAQAEEVAEEVEQVAEEEEEASEESEYLAFSPLAIEDAEKSSENTEESLASEQEIRDSAGRYYSVGSMADAAGKTVFSTLYPEDFSEKNSGINYDVFSSRYPESLTYIVGNKDGNVQMVFMSPQHYWYRKSDYKGQTRSNERDVDNYMQFFTYSGAEGYIEAQIEQSYSDLKGFKFIDKEEFSPEVTAEIEKTSSDHTKELLGDIGDYAKIGSDTVYAAMQAECEAAIYHYEATSRHGNTIYMDFYVPVIANTLGYVSEMASDKGEVIEWLIPEFVVFEAGNEELHNLYEDAFKMFICNSRLTDEFFYINDAYSKDIESAVKIKRAPVRLSAEKLKALYGNFKPSAEINAFGKGVKELLSTKPGSYASFSGDFSVIGTEKSKVCFYSKDKNKVFISAVENEYPGSDYVTLDYTEGSASDSSASDSSESSSDSE